MKQNVIKSLVTNLNGYVLKWYGSWRELVIYYLTIRFF